MSMLTELADHVIGIDPDRDRVTAAVIDATTTGVMARAEFPTTPTGYASALAWVDDHSDPGRRAWSIEGAGAYGAGIAITARAAGEWVIGFDRPLGRAAKDGAKSDGLDAVRAAREVLGHDHLAQPRARGLREGIRALLLVRNGAQRSRVAAINELRALVVTAEPQLREALRGRSIAELVRRCGELDTDGDVEQAATKLALRSVAARVRSLTGEIRDLEHALRPLVAEFAPGLLNEYGVGVVTGAQIIVSWSHPGRCRNEAAFARLAGAAPIEANSGQTQQRFKLSRGGDRALNRALHTIVTTRARTDAATRAYIARRITQGKTPREAKRCLKRYIARHLYRLLENPLTT